MEDFRSGKWLELCYPDFAERERKIQAMKEPGSKAREFRTKIRDGRTIDTSWSSALLTDGSRVAIGQDVTDRKLAERQLETLFRIAGKLSGPDIFQEKCSAVLDELVTIADADLAVLRSLNEDTQQMKLVSHNGTLGGRPLSQSLPPKGFTALVLRTGETVVTNDYPSHPNAIPERISRGIKSTIALPIKVGADVVGIVNINSKHANHFSPEQVRLLDTISGSIGVHLENAWLSEETQDTARKLAAANQELEALLRIAGQLSGQESFKEKCSAVLDEFVTISNADLAVLRLLDDNTQKMELITYAGTVGGRPLYLWRPVTGFTAMALETGEPVVANDYPSHLNAEFGRVSRGIKSTITFPIKVGADVVGVLNVNSVELNHFPPELVRLLDAVVGGIGGLLENARLSKETQDTSRRLVSANQELEALFRIASRLAGKESFPEKCSGVLNELISIANADMAMLRLVDEGTQEPELVAYAGILGKVPSPASIPPHGIAVIAFQTGELVVANDYPSLTNAVPDRVSRGVNSAIAIPLKVRTEVVGVLSVSSKNTDHFSPELVRLLNTIVENIGVHLDNARLSEEAQHTSRKLADANQELETFVYSVSHDLQSPLRAMEGFSQLLIDEHSDELDGDGKDFLQRISGGSKRMSQLVDDLLVYSRLGRADLGLQPVDLMDVMAQVSSHLEMVINDRNAVITTDIPLPMVTGHPATLLQILTNLLNNAMKFVSPGTQPRVRIWAEMEDEHVRLWVEDNGIGIPENDLERIFVPFERLHNRSQFPGSGIGLATVKRGVDRIGGAVGVKSKESSGSRFWVQLKLSRGGR